MLPTVFFSYARAEADRVLPFARELIAAGIDVWVDRCRLVTGRPWDDDVMAAIGERDAFIVALTRLSVTRKEVKDEIAEALRKGKWVLPVLFEPCELPHRIARLHQCRLYSDSKGAFRKLLKDLGMTFDADARAQIDVRRAIFLKACDRQSNINHEEWTAPRQRFLDALDVAAQEDEPTSWYEVLNAGRELRDVMSRLPEGDDLDPHPGHAAPIFSPLVLLTDAIDKSLSGVATGENLTSARAIGLLEQRVNEADRALVSERRNLGFLDRQGKAAIDKAREIIAESVQPAMDRLRQTRDNVVLTSPDVVRGAIETAAQAIGDLMAASGKLATQARTSLEQVRDAAGAFIADTRRRFRAFRIVWTRSLATDALDISAPPAGILVVVRNGTADETVHRVPGRGIAFRDCFRLGDREIEAPAMVVVPAGRFTMGSSPEEIAGLTREHPEGKEWWAWQGPQRKGVVLATPFAVGIAPVTRGQYSAFVAATSRDMSGGAFGWTGSEWKHDAKLSWRDPGFRQGDDHPVVCVSWQDATDYAKWLESQTGKPYRLLSEAEWEYCCRATTITAYHTGDAITKEQANFGGNEKGTTPAGKYKAPNAWGLHDMHGNVLEWCQDNWHPSYQGAPTDGSVWQGGDTSLRVLRGGSWINFPQDLRSANRVRYQPVIRLDGVGFRLARTLLHP